MTIDVPEEQTLNLFETTELREEMSIKLDKALRQAGLGSWVGGRGWAGTIKILFRVTGYETARQLIESKLAEHWLYDSIKISRNAEVTGS